MFQAIVSVCLAVSLSFNIARSNGLILFVQYCSLDARDKVSRRRILCFCRRVGTMARGARSMLPSPSAGMSRWCCWPAPSAGARHPSQAHTRSSTSLLHVTVPSGSGNGSSHPRQDKVCPVISPGACVLHSAWLHNSRILPRS